MSLTLSGQVENTGSGTISALNGAVTVTIPTSSTVAVNITGTWVATLSFEASTDGTNFFTVLATPAAGGLAVSTTTANGAFVSGAGGYLTFRVRASAYTSGTATVSYNADSTPNVQSSGTVQIKGATDGTLIGNTGDRLKVDSTITSVSSGTLATFSNKVVADITQTPIAISSAVTYTNIYTYSGTGKLIGFNLEFNGVNVVVKLVIDGSTIFDGFDLSALNGFLVTADAQYRRQVGSGIVTQSSSLDWSLKAPIGFSTNVTISARLSGGTAKNFQQGIFYISKDT